MKIFFRNVHLILGLAAGLVIMITCFTGAVLVFEDELNHAFNHERYFVEKGTVQLPADELVQLVENQVPNSKVSTIKYHNDPGRSVELSYTISKKREKANDEAAAASNKNAPVKKEGKPAGREGGERFTAFVNPYTGAFIESYSYRESFYFTMFSLHRWLLGGEPGKLIVGISTLIFLFIIITGIVLWWPKTRHILRQRLKLKWNAGWKRANHDLHIVLGFYASVLLFVFAFTGLAWSFEWFNKGIYAVTNSSMERPKPLKSALPQVKGKVSIATVYYKMAGAVPDVEYYNLSFPKNKEDAFSVSVLNKSAAHSSATDQYFVDQYTGNIIGANLYKDRNVGARVRASFKPVHTGSIFGMPSKILAFVCCLLGASFPVTGTIMWINRLRKKKKRKVVAVRKFAEMAD